MDSQLIDMWNWNVMDTQLIYQAEVVEVGRLDKLKETALKMQAKLEQILARDHMVVDKDAQNKILSHIDSGKIEPAQVLDDLDKQIANAKKESSRQKEILYMAEKFLSACEEEIWLEDYDRKNRSSSSGSVSYLDRAAAKKRRAEKARAEKARILVNEIPALIRKLVDETSAWEKALKMLFKYKDAPLLAMLNDYASLKKEREEEKQRKKDQRPIKHGPSVWSRRSPRTIDNSKQYPPTLWRERKLYFSRHKNEDPIPDNSCSPRAIPNRRLSLSKEDAASHLSRTPID